MFVSGIKPKFHYADFPVTFETSPQQTHDVPVDLSATSPTSPCLVADFGQFPLFADTNELVSDFLREFFKTSGHVTMV